MSSRNAKNLTLFFILLLGVVLGGFIGTYLGSLPYLGWLAFGESFSVGSPAVINLGIISFSFSLSITINIAGIIGILIAFLGYKKLR